MLGAPAPQLVTMQHCSGSGRGPEHLNARVSYELRDDEPHDERARAHVRAERERAHGMSEEQIAFETWRASHTQRSFSHLSLVTI